MWLHGCTCGGRHWGSWGAAGVLLGNDLGRVLLQHRGDSDHSGTWSIPGGALAVAETPTEAALRELEEETGIHPSAVEIGPVEVTTDHGTWKYWTVAAQPTKAVLLAPNRESRRLCWVYADAVAGLTLHPAFREAWEHDTLQSLRAFLRL